MGFFDGIRRLTQPFDEESFYEDDEFSGVAPQEDIEDDFSDAPYYDTAQSNRNAYLGSTKSAPKRGGLPRREKQPSTRRQPVDYKEHDFSERDFEEPRSRQSDRRERYNEGDDFSYNAETAPNAIHLAKPTKFSDGAAIVDELRQRKIVMLNVSEMSRDDANRISDYLRGASYALGCAAKTFSPGVLIISPKGVDIDDNLPRGMAEAMQSREY